MKEKEITKVLDALIEKEITYDEAKDKLFVLYGVSGSFEPKCSVKVAKTGENCPEKPTKEINGELVCDKCYENWKHLENNDR